MNVACKSTGAGANAQTYNGNASETYASCGANNGNVSNQKYNPVMNGIDNALSAVKVASESAAAKSTSDGTLITTAQQNTRAKAQIAIWW